MEKLRYPLILSSFKLYEYCKNRYKKRTVIAEKYVDYEDFYYWSRAGKQRLVRNKKEIWVLGKECPEIVRKR